MIYQPLPQLCPLPPDRVSTFGRAWRVDLQAIRAIDPTINPSAVLAWMVECAWAHPSWYTYGIWCTHLRGTPEGLRPHVIAPGATHQVAIYPLDPAREPRPDRPLPTLYPPTLLLQWIADDDAVAGAMMDAAIDLILARRLSPVPDAPHGPARLPH